jgi:hypothetical protein
MDSLTVSEPRIASMEPHLIARIGMSGPATKTNMNVTFHESILKDKPFVNVKVGHYLIGLTF